mmetsp:Transcript_5486/g.13867  ORF Transcript_5486/g.13867 Transcript_5486/m.13867 type:complete len:493 (-) Transcript_5486:544-2022(-)
MHRQDGQEEEREQLDCASDAVHDVVLHALEDGARDDNCVNNHAKSGGSEDDVGRRARGVRGTLHGNADIRALQRRGVVHAVSRHTARPATLAQRLNDEKLVLGEHLRESVDVLDHLSVVVADRLGQLLLRVHHGEHVSLEDVRSHAQHAARLLCDCRVVTRDHLHVAAVLDGALDRHLRVGPRRVEEGEESVHLHRLALVRDGHGERANASLRQLLDRAVELVLNLRAVSLTQGQQHVRRALRDGENAPLRVPQRRLRALLHRIERDVLELLVRVERSLVHGVQHERVKRILRRFLPLGGKRGESQDVLLGESRNVREVVLKNHLVERERSRLVAAQHVHARELLDGCQARDDRLLVSQHAASECHGGGAHHLHRDGNGRDEKHDAERNRLEDVLAMQQEVSQRDGDRDDAESHETERDSQNDFLEVAHLVNGLDERRRFPEERFTTRGAHHRFHLTSCDIGSHFCDVSRTHRHGKRLARQSCLIHLDECAG